jgi:hypothetical protein
VLAFYVGNEVDKLSEQKSQASFGGPECSRVRDGITSLFLTGGKVQVMVDGNNFYVPPALPPVTEGPLTLQIEETPPAPNDDFENAAVLTGQTFEEPDGNRSYFGSQFGYNYNATKQMDEPNHAGDSGGSSVWYTWTAPESDVVRFSLCCATTANLLAVYTGNAIDALLPLKSGEGAVELSVAEGTTYRIAVESKFNLFLGGTFDDKFNLMVQMKLDPGPGSGASGGPPATTPADTIPPETTLLHLKKPRKPTTRFFAYRSSESSSTFRCRLDRRPFATCGPSRTYRNLKPGRHKFEVFAIDAAGNKDPTPVVVRFKVPKPKAKV